MNQPADTPGVLTRIHRDLRRHWVDLALTDIAFRILAAVILVPLAGLLFRGLLALSGGTVLADHDILHFLLGPLGWISVILLGAVAISIYALSVAALMAIARGTDDGGRLRARGALRFALRASGRILNVTARLVVVGLLFTAPFLAVAGLLFFLLLTEYDINYYLAMKPPVFRVAVAAIGAVLVAMALVLVRVMSAWIFALPLLLFERVAPRDALRVSRERAVGQRWKIVKWLVAWAVASVVLMTASSALVGALGRLLISGASNSLFLLALSTGLMLLLWFLVNFGVSLLSTVVFALGLMRLYEPVGEAGSAADGPVVPDGAGRRWVSRKSLAAGLVAALIGSAVVGWTTIHDFEVEDRATITAHRGASADAPENSLSSVRRAIADRADWVEIDVQQTADDVVIVCHDRDLKKLAGSDLVVAETTAEELRRVDVGSSFSPEFAGERMPTLDEVLAACRGKAGVNIELKHFGPARGLERLVVERVEAHGMAEQVVIMSLDHAAVARMRVLRPDWKVGLLAAVALGDLTGGDAHFLAVGPRIANRAFVRRAHDAGKEVYVWTINDPVVMSRMFSMGIDSLITDEPALARRVLELRAGMSPLERMLLEVATFFDQSPRKTLTDDDA